MLGEPFEDDLESATTMERGARPGEFVGFAGETPEHHGLAEPAQRDEQLLRLADRAADVVLAVDDQHRHVDLGGETHRRHAQVLLRIGDRIDAVLDSEHRADVARPLLGQQVVDGAFGAHGSKAPSVTGGEQGRHVPAVAPTLHSDTPSITNREAIEGGVDHRDHVVEVGYPPTSAGSDRMLGTEDRLTPSLLAPGTTARIRHHDDEPSGYLSLRLIEERLAVLGVGPAVHVDDHW